KIFGVVGNPRMVLRYVVWNEVQNQTDTSLRKFLTRCGKSFRTAQVLIDYVASHTIGRSHVILRLKVRQNPRETIQQTSVLIGDGNPGETPFPNSHQPYGIETMCHKRVPFCCRNGV